MPPHTNTNLAELALNALQTMAEIAAGDLTCGVCHGKGKTKFQPPRNGRYTVRTCERCSGSGKERITPDLRVKMARELIQYASPSSLIGPATERMRALLESSSDATALEAAGAILKRIQTPAAQPRVPYAQ